MLGYISEIRDFGAMVKFFGKLHGLVPTKDPEVLHSLILGNLTKVRVVGIDKDRGHLRLSFDLREWREIVSTRRTLITAICPG